MRNVLNRIKNSMSLTAVPFVTPNDLVVFRTLSALNIPIWYVPRSGPKVTNTNDTQNLNTTMESAPH